MQTIFSLPLGQPRLRAQPLIRTEGRWIGGERHALMVWRTVADGCVSRGGAVILPPIGYAYWSAHRTLRVLAEKLACEGQIVLRLDYEGVGDSAGGQWDPERLARWRVSVQIAAAELARLGCSDLTLVGVRLGATIALLEGSTVDARTIVAWAPVVSGRRFVKETRLLSTPVPRPYLPHGTDAAVVAAGTVFTSATLTEIAALELTKMTEAPAPSALLVNGTRLDALAGRLTDLGVRTKQMVLGGGETALETPAEYATVPTDIVDGIAGWVSGECAVGARGTGTDSGGVEPVTRDETGQIPFAGLMLRERIVTLGQSGLLGVMTERPDADTEQAMIVFLNSGSESHIGPGRAWVEYARALAHAGRRCLRVDFSGWGESPDDGHAPGRPYDQHCEHDTVMIVRALRELGHRRVVLVGLCASAWVALRAISREPVAAVVALNPQLYWQPGDPVEATMQETRLRRAPQRRCEELGRRVGLWSLLDSLGYRPWAARWLDDLSEGPTPVLLAFAEGDDGIEFLRNRLSRQLRRVASSGRLTVLEMPEIDHSMHRVWLRSTVVQTIDQYVCAVAH